MGFVSCQEPGGITILHMNSQLEAFLEHINQINSRFELMCALAMNAQRQLFSLPPRAKVQERMLPCIRKQEVGSNCLKEYWIGITGRFFILPEEALNSGQKN